jgi:hypothetical protein
MSAIGSPVNVNASAWVVWPGDPESTPVVCVAGEQSVFHLIAVRLIAVRLPAPQLCTTLQQRLLRYRTFRSN